MAERVIKEKVVQEVEEFVDDFESVPREEWVNFSVPFETVVGDVFPSPIRINGHEFHSGQNVAPPEYAQHVAIIIEGVQREAVRRLQPKKDLKALRQQAGSGQQGATPIL